MNTDAEKNINEAIDWLQQSAAEHAPAYCQEVINWNMTVGVIGVMVGLAFLIFGAYSVRKLKASYKDRDECGVFLWILPALLFGLMGMFATVGSSLSIAKTITSPRMVIIEHLRGPNH